MQQLMFRCRNNAVGAVDLLRAFVVMASMQLSPRMHVTAPEAETDRVDLHLREYMLWCGILEIESDLPKNPAPAALNGR